MTSGDPSPSRSQPMFGVVKSPKHFLTWSATAANHKLQKLSKSLAQNVSRLQSKVDKVFQNPGQNPAENVLTTESLNSRISDGATTRTQRHLSNNEDDAQEHQHLLAVNNVHVAVVHNLNLTKGQIPKRNNIDLTKVNNHGSPPLSSPPPLISNHWKDVACRSRSRQKFDFELEKNVSKSFDIFELTAVKTDDLDQSIPTGEHSKVERSSRSSDTTGSDESHGASTVSPLSPHCSSRSSSWTSTATDAVLFPDVVNNQSSCTAPASVQANQVDLGDLTSSTSAVKAPTELSLRVLEAEPELRQAAWFHAGIPREVALEVLKNEPVGSFVVRESSTRCGCFALSLRVPPDFQPAGIAHYLIIRNKGYKIKGFTKEFGTLTSLVTHHSVMPEMLPCPLYRSAPPPSISRTNSADFMEPEKLFAVSPKMQHAASPSEAWKCTEF